MSAIAAPMNDSARLPIDAAPPAGTASGDDPAPIAGRRPVGEGERIAAIDVIRGIAILGIAAANLPSFALPSGAAASTHYVSPHWSEAAAVFVKATLVDYEFISIFALLFGAGLALQRERAHAAGRGFAAFYAWRLTLLAVIGLCHACLLWFGDILFWYALTGLLALLLAGLPARVQAALGGLSLVVPVVFSIGVAIVVAALGIATLEEWTGVPQSTAAAALADPRASTLGVEYLWHPGRETLIYRDGGFIGYPEMLLHRVTTWAIMGASFFIFFGWRIAGLFLIGMSMMRAGVFADPGRHRRLLLGMLIVGAGVGLPLEAVHGWLTATGPASPTVMMLGEAMHQVSSLLLAGGYVAAIVLLGARWRPIAAVGRMALSNYLLQTVIAVTIFYYYGFGMFGEVSRVGLWAIAGGMGVGLIVFSLIWLRLFRFGPVEWVWRTVAYGAWQPMRR